MNLQIDLACSARYKSKSQIVRVATEKWAADNLYCPACSSDEILPETPNKQCVDFRCPSCSGSYELKACSAWNPKKITDAGYKSMMAAILSDTRPNLLVLNYSDLWFVRSLVLVPGFVLTKSVIERRKPLAETARRAGWVGCNILLGQIPADGKISLVSEGIEAHRSEVRKSFDRMRPLESLRVELRGWALDVLRVIRRLGKPNFTLAEVYQFVPELQRLHPHNLNIRPKIRQQLQVLRSIGLLRFRGEGQYTLIMG